MSDEDIFRMNTVSAKYNKFMYLFLGRMKLTWIEFDVHIRNRVGKLDILFNDVASTLLSLIAPFINRHRNRLQHWHYLLEPDLCRGREYLEIRMRLEVEAEYLTGLRDVFMGELSEFCDKTHITMRPDELLGSHEGQHGRRGETYKGAQSEDFEEDWPAIVEIMEKGSDFSLDIFRLGTQLNKRKAKAWTERPNRPVHPYYLHLPANQLFVEL